jgi:hypothetical protein
VAEHLPRDRRIDSGSAAIAAMPIEPIESIPGPPSLIEVGQGFRPGRISQAEQLSQYDFAVQEAMARFEVIGSKVVTDDEQAQESFAMYPPSRSNEHCRRRNSDARRGWQARIVSAHNIGGRSGNDSELKIWR